MVWNDTAFRLVQNSPAKNHLHRDAVTLNKQSDGVQVGWILHTEDFSYEVRFNEDDGTLSFYVEWGDDQPGDMGSFDNWAEARSHLQVLLRAAGK